MSVTEAEMQEMAALAAMPGAGRAAGPAPTPAPATVGAPVAAPGRPAAAAPAMTPGRPGTAVMPSPAASGVSDAEMREMDRLAASGMTAGAGTRPASTPPVVPGQANIIRRAPAPPTPGEPEPTFGEAALGFGKNLPRSTWQAVRQLGEAVTNPVETYQGLKEIVRGAASKAVGSVGSMAQDPEIKAQNEAVLDAIIEDYAKRYGSWADFKRAMISDPASIVMDLSTLVTGGASAAAKVAGKTTALGRAATKVADVASLVDPLNAPITAAGKVAGAAIGVPVRAALEKMSGVPAQFQKIATTIKDATPEAQAAFFRYMKGDGSPAELATKIDNAFDLIRRDASNNFFQKKRQLLNNRVDVNSASQEIARRLAEAQSRGSQHGAQNRIANLQALQTMINDVLFDPARQSLQSVDTLKQQLDTRIRTAGLDGDRQAYGDLVAIRREVRDALSDPTRGGDREYSNLMDMYRTGQNEIAEVMYLAGGRGASSERIKRAIARVKKSPFADDAMAALGKVDPELPPALAGASMRAWDSQGAETLLGALASTGTFLYLAHPAALAGVLPTMPRVVGSGSTLASGIKKRTRQFATGYVPQRIAYAGSIAGGVGEQREAEPDAAAVAMGKKIEADPYFPAILMNESSNSHYRIDPDTGQPTNEVQVSRHKETGEVLAVGWAQVAPKTGPEAAALAGEPWSLDRLYNDPEYNRRLGYAYFQKQLNDFGDVYLAAAAYNAGPGRLRRAMAKADRPGETGNYFDYLPEETQDYLRKMQAQLEARETRASGGRVSGKETVLVNRLMQRVKQAHQMITQETKPLLNVPDEAVARALEVANQAI